MLTVYHSNQLDVLKEIIAALIEREPLTNIFAPEMILVQSPGMAQWLQIELAERLGIAANMSFPLPATFIWEMFTKIIPNVAAESAFNKEAMAWKLMSLLPDCMHDPVFSLLADYLQDDPNGRKCYQLAIRIADLYDQYLVYRPEWLNVWERGELVTGVSQHQLWQSYLWRRLVEYTHQLQQPKWHRANLYHRFITQLEQTAVGYFKLPQRLFICGISSFPPIYLEALHALGRHCEIHLMLTNPCRLYWGDLQEPSLHDFAINIDSPVKQQYRFEAIQQLIDYQPLLASWGKQGRDNLFLLSQWDDLREIEAFVEIKPDTLLHRLQRDILLLTNQAQHDVLKGSEPALKQLLKSQDHSVQIHVCHSMQREVEVLHDELLRLFDQEPTLTPRDVLVMVADVDSYTPYIQAVFGSVPAEHYLPFTISDRCLKGLHPVLQVFLQLLSLPDNRFNAEDICAFLEVPAVASKFGFNEQDLSLVRRWVTESGIYWGLDDDHVQEYKLPVTEQYTWQFGLKRMLLGYAMNSQVGIWQQTLPYDDTQGLIAELVGQLAEFLARLRQWRQWLMMPKTLVDWEPIARQLCEDFFLFDDAIEPLVLLIEQYWQLIITNGMKAEYTSTLEIVIIRDAIKAKFDHERSSQRFLAGTINFCTFMPMRAIPFKVICLLGMNEGLYPRIHPPSEFDLITLHPQRGDRNRRDDDRYLFLEALTCAQDYFYISYIGRSIQDNTERYPSILVNELLDYIEKTHIVTESEQKDTDKSSCSVSEVISYLHPRTPFDTENYRVGTRYQSYAKEWLPVVNIAQRKNILNNHAPLAEYVAEKIELEDLIRFFRHPIRYFYQQRMGVFFNSDGQERVEHEPFRLTGLERYHINHALLTQLIKEDPNRHQLLQTAIGTGKLPYGSFGLLEWTKQQKEMTEVALRVREDLQPIQQAIEIEIAVPQDNITLTGWLNGVQNNGLVRWCPTVINAREILSVWIEHLAYCALSHRGTSRLYAKDKTTWIFSELTTEQAVTYLAQLIKGYQQGMQRPFYLLPNLCWQWIQICFKQQGVAMKWDVLSEQAKMQIKNDFYGNSFQPGAQQDLYTRRAIPMLTEEIMYKLAENTQQYLLPLLIHRQ